MPGGQTGLGCSSPDISRPIYAELLLIRFLSCPWEPLCGISRISPGISLCIFPGCHPVPPPASCPLPPGSPKRVNLVRLYFFINLSGSAQLARHTWAPRLPTADYSYFAYPLIEGYAPLPGRARATRKARGYRGLGFLVALAGIKGGGLTPYSCGNLDSRPARSSEPWKSN